MKITSNVLDVLILLGAIQGFISCLLLFRQQRYAQRLLATIVMILSLACLNIFLLDIGVKRTSAFWYIFSLGVPLIYAMPIGPLLYFYCKAILQPDFKITRRERFHFYPILLDLLPGILGITFLFLSGIGRPDEKLWTSVIDNYNTYVDIPRWCSLSLYVWFSWKLFRQNTSQEPEASSWMKKLLSVFTGFQLIWLTHLIPYIIPAASALLLEWLNWYPLYIPLAVLVYWLGVNGFLISAKISRHGRAAALDQQTISNALSVLTTAMEVEKLYLKPTLSLNDVVVHTGLTQKLISTVLNQYKQITFNEFVNAYRVQEVKNRLAEGGYDHLTLTGLALECGFNSQATFQRTFKQITGQTPRTYQLSLKEIA